jgi:hypothetical protein
MHGASDCEATARIAMHLNSIMCPVGPHTLARTVPDINVLFIHAPLLISLLALSAERGTQSRAPVHRLTRVFSESNNGRTV